MDRFDCVPKWYSMQHTACVPPALLFSTRQAAPSFSRRRRRRRLTDGAVEGPDEDLGDGDEDRGADAARDVDGGPHEGGAGDRHGGRHQKVGVAQAAPLVPEKGSGRGCVITYMRDTHAQNQGNNGRAQRTGRRRRPPGRGRRCRPPPWPRRSRSPRPVGFFVEKGDGSGGSGGGGRACFVMWMYLPFPSSLCPPKPQRRAPTWRERPR